jgi:hypothetical protein
MDVNAYEEQLLKAVKNPAFWVLSEHAWDTPTRASELLQKQTNDPATWPDICEWHCFTSPPYCFNSTAPACNPLSHQLHKGMLKQHVDTGGLKLYQHGALPSQAQGRPQQRWLQCWQAAGMLLQRAPLPVLAFWSQDERQITEVHENSMSMALTDASILLEAVAAPA